MKPTCSAALILLLAWESLASGQEPPKPPGTSDLPPGVRWLRDLEYVPGGNLDQSSGVQCVVDWFGPTDLATMGGRYDEPNSSVARLIGEPVQKNKEKAAKASPLHYVTKYAAPFLIMQGDQDDVVPPSQSVKLAAALRQAGVEVTLQVYKGSGHGGRAFTSPESWKLIEDFFARHLHAEKPAQRQQVTATVQVRAQIVSSCRRRLHSANGFPQGSARGDRLPLRPSRRRKTLCRLAFLAELAPFHAAA